MYGRYRIHSPRGTQFRQWATRHLKADLQEIEQLEKRVERRATMVSPKAKREQKTP